MGNGICARAKCLLKRGVCTSDVWNSKIPLYSENVVRTNGIV